MKNKNYDTIEPVLKFTRKIVETETKLMPLTHKYMTWLGMGTCKVRNEIETKRNRTKRNEIKQNKTKQNETKRNRSKRNETKCNEKKK